MNFLAHLHLSGPDPGWMLGGILGDIVRGRVDKGRFPEPVRQGIILHRKIDSLTDSHPEWLKSKKLLPTPLRRFSGIVIDVIFDHFLAAHWTKFSSHHFDSWVTTTYSLLIDQINLLRTEISDPAERLEEASQLIEMMSRRDWLRSYLDPDNIPKTLERISHRSPRLAPMRDGFDYHAAHEGFERQFLRFYPDLIDAAQTERSSQMRQFS